MTRAREWLLLGALAGSTACGGPLSRAVTAYESGDYATAESEARRAEDRGQPGAQLIVVDTLIARGDALAADQALSSVTGEPDAEVRLRSMAIAALDSDARRYASEWRDAFEAGEPLPAPVDARFLGAVFVRLINDSQAAAIALLGELPDDVATHAELASTIESALDVALYQMHYRGDVRAVQGAVRAFRTVLGPGYVLDKHEVAAELYRIDRLSSSARDELERKIDALTGGSTEALAELAQEFSTRGAYPAGAAAFHLAAERAPTDSAQWLQGAANAEYLAGEEQRARESLEAAAGSPHGGLTAAYDVALRHRDNAHLFRFVVGASEAPCSEPERAGIGELLRARTEIAAGRAEGVGDRVRARLDQCELPGLAATVGMALVDSGDFVGAEPLLRHAVLRRVDDPELIATYLYVSEEAGIEEYQASIAADAVARVQQSSSTPTVLRLLQALNRTGDPAVRALADSLLFDALEASPADFALVSEQALRFLDTGDQEAARNALSRYTRAAPDELSALLGAARWISNHFDEPQYIAAAYESVAQHPESARTFEPLQGRSAAEFAWLQAARQFAAAGAAQSTLDAIWGFVRAAGADESATWEELWAVEELFAVLAPRSVLELGEHAAALGIPMAEVQMRLGASYVEMGESSSAQRAYSAALAEDPTMLAEVMRWLDRVDDRAVLISVLHSIDPARRPYQVWVALAVAHAEEAGRNGLSERMVLEHRVDARLAFRTAITINPAGSFRSQTFADAGLHDVAAELHLRDLAADPGSLTSLQLSLLSLAASGAPRSEMDPLITRALEEFEEAALSRLRVALYQNNYTRDALDVGRRQLQLEARTSEALEATAASIVGYAIELEEIDEAQEMIDLYFAFPASRLAEPDGIPPARYLNVRDRDARAAALMGTASRLYESAELWALATQASLRRLELSGSSSQLILNRALLSSLRMTGGEVSRSQLDRIAEAAGGGPEAWRALGVVAQTIERPEVAILCWSRALELVPDDWSAELELGQLRALAGQQDRALGHFLRAINGARLDGREAQTALYAAAAFSRTGRGDLAIEVLEVVPNSSQVSLRLADYELAAGLPARAIRRLARTGVPPGEAARIYLRHGHLREGIDLWRRRANSMSPDEAENLLASYTDAAFETLPFSQALALVEITVGRASAGDPQLARSELLARSGRPLAAAAVLEAALTGGGSNEVWRDLAALYVAGGELRVAQQAATNGQDSSDPRWSLTSLEIQAGQPPSRSIELSAPEALALGEYESVLALSPAVDASPAERETHANALRTTAASGFEAEAWALIRPTLRGRFRAETWSVAASLGGNEIAAALRNRASEEPELTAQIARELLRVQRYSAVEDLIAGRTPYGPGFNAIVNTQLSLMHRDRNTASTRVERWIADEADPFWVAVAARDMGFTALASDIARDIDGSDEALLWRFEVTYWSGDVDRATDELMESLPTARTPHSLLIQAIERVHPVADNEGYLRLVDRALLGRPGELELLLLRTLHERDESRIGLRQLSTAVDCNPAGLTHSVAWLVRRNGDQAAVALADGCADLPVRARVSLGLIGGELPDLDELEPGQATRLAVIANGRGQSELALQLASRALRSTNSADAHAQRAIAAARLGDEVEATHSTDLYLRETHDLTSTGGAVLSALSLAGMLDSADLVAEALGRLPANHSGFQTGGTAMLIGAFIEGSPVAGLRYLEDRLPDVLRLAAIAGLTTRVASLLEAAGDSAGAIATYRAHLELWPNDPTAQNNLAFLLLEHTGEFVEAEDLARSAILNAGRISTSVADTLAWALYRQGRYEEALTFSGLSVRLSPSEPGFAPESESQSQLLEHWEVIQGASSAHELPTAPVRPRRGRRGRRDH